MKADLVAGIMPVRSDGRMLLLQRPTGTWEPPAGRLAPGESFEEGAVRELYEETGLLLAPRHLLATWVGEGPKGALASVTYASRVATGEEEVRLSHEHLDYAWLTLEEWLNLPSWWSRADRLRVVRPLEALPAGSPEPPPPPESPPRPGVVNAVLGAGVVLADPGERGSSDEPRALLMRRRKPPVGLWENPGGSLEPGEDFLSCARREAREETGLDVEPGEVWFTRVEPWKAPDDPELYAGVGFLATHPRVEIRLEEKAHDAYRWVTETEWRSLRTWYTERDSDALWTAIGEMGS